MILDYKCYSSQSEEYGLNTGRRNNDESSLFFHKREYCVFCNKQTKKTYSNSRVDTESIRGVAWHKTNEVFTCSCGWWEHTFHGYLEGESQGFKDWAFEIDSAILREFEIESKDVPVESLREYLIKNKDHFYSIHHKKMEELVASVFREHFDCEAHVVGKTSDGGVDLILLEADQPIIVQVKRRMKPGKVEPVNLIRELIGATLLKDSRRCIYVTTADRFSRNAVKESRQAIEKGIVDTFELYDFDKINNVLKLNSKNTIDPWSKLITR